MKKIFVSIRVLCPSINIIENAVNKAMNKVFDFYSESQDVLEVETVPIRDFTGFSASFKLAEGFNNDWFSQAYIYLALGKELNRRVILEHGKCITCKVELYEV